MYGLFFFIYVANFLKTGFLKWLCQFALPPARHEEPFSRTVHFQWHQASICMFSLVLPRTLCRRGLSAGCQAGNGIDKEFGVCSEGSKCSNMTMLTRACNQPSGRKADTSVLPLGSALEFPGTLVQYLKKNTLTLIRTIQKDRGADVLPCDNPGLTGDGNWG